MVPSKFRKGKKMFSLSLDHELVKEEEKEEVQGETLFSLKNVFIGLLSGGMDYVDEINRAIDEAYASR